MAPTWLQPAAPSTSESGASGCATRPTAPPARAWRIAAPPPAARDTRGTTTAASRRKLTCVVSPPPTAARPPSPLSPQKTKASAPRSAWPRSRARGWAVTLLPSTATPTRRRYSASPAWKPPGRRHGSACTIATSRPAATARASLGSTARSTTTETGVGLMRFLLVRVCRR